MGVATIYKVPVTSDRFTLISLFRIGTTPHAAPQDQERGVTAEKGFAGSENVFEPHQGRFSAVPSFQY
jgi:hypothetical protein